MIDYLLINSILTCSALAINFWLKIPHRMRFYTMMFALSTWLVPFGLIDIEVSHETAALLPVEVIELNPPITAASTAVDNQIDVIFIIIALMMLGVLLFIRDLISNHYFTKALMADSKIYKNYHHIRLSNDINGAFVSGYTQPIIWINQDYQHLDIIDTIIKHEKTHIKNHDQFWLVAITLLQRIMWFNPLIQILCRKSRAAIELSCDEACKKDIGKEKYQTDLAKIILKSQPQISLLHNPINHNKRFNIERINQLETVNHMSNSNKTKFSLIVLSALCLASITLVTVAKEQPPHSIKDHQVLLTLKIKDSDQAMTELSVLTEQGEMANVTYAGHDFGFTTQVLPDEPSQIYTDIVISQIDDGLKTVIANPAIVTTNTRWGAFKFGQGKKYFDIEIKAQTSSLLDPETEAVQKYIELNDPAPALISAAKTDSVPQPAAVARPAIPSAPTKTSAVKPPKAPSSTPPLPATPSSVEKVAQPPQPQKPANKRVN